MNAIHVSRKLLSHQQFHKLMVGEINSPFNTWVTAEKLGRRPDYFELYVHYILHGGYRNFLERYGTDPNTPIAHARNCWREKA